MNAEISMEQHHVRIYLTGSTRVEVNLLFLRFYRHSSALFGGL